MLANYFNEVCQLGIHVDFNSMFGVFPNLMGDRLRGPSAHRFRNRPDVPLLMFDHGSARIHRAGTPVIFLVRGMFDTLVSNFFQWRNRLGQFDGGLVDFLTDHAAGVRGWVDFHNEWASALQQFPHRVITYESMHESTHQVLAEVLAFIGAPVRDASVRLAVERSEFNTMQRVEVDAGFPNRPPGHPACDPDALRARRGEVGGYKTHIGHKLAMSLRRYAEERLNDSARALLMTNQLTNGGDE